MTKQISRQQLARLESALVAKNEGDLPKAEKILLDILQKEPEFAAVYNNLGSVYFAMERWQKALGAFKAAIANQPDYIDAYYNLGLTYKKLDNSHAAITAFESIIKLNKEHPGAHFQLGSLLMQHRRYIEASSEFEYILESGIDHVESQINLALCYLKLGRLKQARARYLSALSSSADDEVILYNLGVICSQLGEVDAALDYYQQAIAKKPDYLEAYNNLAVICLVKNDRQQALYYFQQAQRIQPDNEAIAYSISALQGHQQVVTPPAVYISNLFDAYADHYDAHMRQGLAYQLPAQIMQFLQQSNQFENRKWDILDIGCGTGLCLEYLKAYANLAHGVDLSARMLDQAEEKQLYDQLFCQDMNEFLLEHNKAYELIIAGDVFVYQGDLAHTMELIAKRLKVGGLLVFNTEIAQKSPFVQLESGRFAHHQQYLRDLVTQFDFQLLQLQKVMIRTQADKMVWGYLVLARQG